MVADLLTWVSKNGLEVYDIRPFLVGGAQARLSDDQRTKTMSRPPTTDTELESARSLAYDPGDPMGGTNIDIWMDVSNPDKFPAGIYPKSLTHPKAVVQRRLEVDSVWGKFLNWVVKVRPCLANT